MKPLYKQPLVEAVILASGILCTVVLIHGVQNFIALGGKPVASQIAQKTNTDLVQVAAGSGCPYSANVSLGQTAGGTEMRDRPDKNMKVYDPFSSQYENQSSGTEKPGTAKAPGTVDSKLPVIGTIFGYKPQSVNYYKVLEKNGTALTGTRWEQYLIGVPTEVGAEIRAPQTGYDIGGGKMGLVVYATSDQITIHVGRHEYLSGDLDKPAESGGYWIYLKGLCVNREIVSQYNANAASRTQLPELAKGELLGYATSAEVLVAVRDNGPFQDILAPAWWGSVPAGSAAAPPVDGPIVLAGDVSNNQISGNIDLFDVETKHKDLLRTTGDVAVAGDSTTDISPFPFLLEGKVPIKVAEGKQGANWLKGQIENFPNNGRFALILIGVEEVQNGNVNAEMPNAGKLSDYESNLDAIVKGVLKKGTIPVLQEVNDFNSQSGMEANRKIVNDAMAQVAKNNNVPLVKTPYITASHMKEDGYHFNAAGEKLRNQILGVVNTKLIALAASSAAPASNTVSGKIKLNGKGTYTIDIYQTDSGTNYKRTDSDRVVTNLTSLDQVEWSFVPKEAKTCIFARMWTQAEPVGEEKWVDSIIRCDLKPGDKDIELTITAPAVLAPAATNHTISGKVDLVGGTLGKKIILVYLEKEDGSLVSGRSSWADTSNRYSITEVPPGKYKLVADLDFDVGDGLIRKEIAQSEKVGVEISTKDVTKDLTIKVPSEISSKIYIRASKSAIENCTAAEVSAYCALSTTFDRRYSEAFIDITGPGTVTVTYNAQDVTELGQTYWQVKIENIKTKDPFATTDINFAVVTKSSPPYISLKPTHFEKIIK